MSKINACLLGPISAKKRRHIANEIRKNAAEFYKNLPYISHPCNGDEFKYSLKIGNFSKALPHNKLGEVDLGAYQNYIEALETGNPECFEKIPLGGVLKLANPQAAYAYELVGPDSHQLAIPPPPPLSSAAAADQMVELYWYALTRDVPYLEYDNNPLTKAAAAELTTLSDFTGPRIDGKVTPKTLFRDNILGDLVGPYISQFLLKPVPYGATTIEQRYPTTVPGDNYLTSYPEWLSVQNGSLPSSSNDLDPVLRYIRNGRDLGAYVHSDFSFEDGLNACLILLSYGNPVLTPSSPYLHSKTQTAFATFGPPHALDFTVRATRPALEAAWFQKWLVQRLLCPEEFGGLIQNTLTRAADYPINNQVLTSQAAQKVFKKYGTYLLPQAYAEGCPAHPSYPAGHATLMGAMVTILKAFFDESFFIPDPVQASTDGLSLIPYKGTPLTVGGELNKLASNISNGRNAAGVHYRCDAYSGLRLGEAIAIGILHDYKKTYNESFEGFTFTTFDGKTLTI